MIQRKQSLWLLLAALLNSGVLYFDLFKIHTVLNGVETIEPYRVEQHYPILIIAILMIAVPLLTIFMFGDRKRQVRMSISSIIIIFIFISKLLLSTSVPPPATITYSIGAVLPVISFVLVIMAIVGIRRDDKLVKSADRLR